MYNVILDGDFVVESYVEIEGDGVFYLSDYVVWCNCCVVVEYVVDFVYFDVVVFDGGFYCYVDVVEEIEVCGEVVFDVVF